MRPIIIIVIGVMCVSHAAQSPRVLRAAPASPEASSLQPSAVIVHLWTTSGEKTIEDTFNIDLITRKSTSHTSKLNPAGETPEWAKATIADRNRNLPTYERIVERFKARPKQAGDADLAEALRSIEAYRGAGYEPGDFVVASPDGAYAVIKEQLKPLLLIDVATLNTYRLLDNAGDQTPPVAWSADSRHLAFALPKPRELRVYDLQQKTISVVTPDAPWIEALSWSPNGDQIAAFALENRRMVKNPLAIIAAGAGHPNFKNDGVLFVYRFGSADIGREFSVPLKRGISEQGGLQARIEWK